MTDINRDKINQFVRGLGDRNQGQGEAPQQETAASEPAPAAPAPSQALDPDVVLAMMNSSAAPIQQFMSVQSGLAKFDPFLKAIEDAFTDEFGGYFTTLGEERRRDLVLRAANDMMDRNLV